MMFLGRKKSNNHIQLLAQFSKLSTKGWGMFLCFFCKSFPIYLIGSLAKSTSKQQNETGTQLIISSKQDQWLNFVRIFVPLSLCCSLTKMSSCCLQTKMSQVSGIHRTCVKSTPVKWSTWKLEDRLGSFRLW